MRALSLCLLIAGCSFEPHSGGTEGDADGDDDFENPAAACEPVAIPLAGRPIELMPPDRLAAFASRAPCVAAGALYDVLTSPRTLWYDKRALPTGYQDSFGDNVQTPIGMRPNTIDPELIDLAVPGGHAQIFAEPGVFHFPFGKPLGPAEDVVGVNFLRLPGDPTYQPIVHWQRDPNGYTHRVEWMFPAGTVIGELLFLDQDGELHPFEIRTRTRTLDGWANDVYRPFPRATEFASAIQAGATSPALDALVVQLRTGALEPLHVAATHFPGAFTARDAGSERLPALTGDDATVVRALLRATPFTSARGIEWKRSAGLTAWAAGAAGPGSIVPRDYNAAAIEVSEASCEGCHRDAGRPFETWYSNILAYGELWGNDETFTFHPFTIERFVDASGNVQNFNHDNREIRPDFVAAGLVAPYSPANHPATLYRRIVREWTDFVY